MSVAAHADRIQLVPHRREWAAEFLALGALARETLGDAAQRIDHIGSTSVPGLVAKDVIDVQITVAALEAVRAPLAAAGFVEHGPRSDAPPPGANWMVADANKLLWREPPGTRRANVHVRVAGRANQRVPLVMRDYLRSHRDAAAAYAEFKLCLARAVAEPGSYAEVKDPVFHLLRQAAERWAAETAWQPGATDA